MLWTPVQIVEKILLDTIGDPTMARNRIGHAFAPTNIALIKYWGKRDDLIHLPMNSSFSVSLAHKGASAWIELSDQPVLIVNQENVALSLPWVKKIFEYLSWFGHVYQVRLEVNIPFAAGLASSACIFAALAMALNDLYQWHCTPRVLSILARLGSGSAARSIESGFVEWHKGQREDGMDSYGERMDAVRYDWPELCVGLCVFDKAPKSVSSREAMARTVQTSGLYSAWPAYAEQALLALKTAIRQRDFNTMGQIVEQNALTMHALMHSAWPPVMYGSAKTWDMIERVGALRQQGCAVYFTQDAGPNVKLLFLEKDRAWVESINQSDGTEIEVIQPFGE